MCKNSYIPFIKNFLFVLSSAFVKFNVLTEKLADGNGRMTSRFQQVASLIEGA